MKHVVYKLSGITWLFLMLFLPGTLTGIKFSMLVILMFSALSIMLTNNIINRNKIWGILIAIVLGVFYIGYGYLTTNTLDFKLIEMYIFTPIAAYLISYPINNDEKMKKLIEVTIIITLIIVTYDTLYILIRMGVLPVWLIPKWVSTFTQDISGSFYLNNNIVEARITNQSSLMFLMPLLINLYLTQANLRFRKCVIITIILGFFVTLFSGRRALQLIVFISIFLFFILFKNKKSISFKNGIFFIFIISIVVLLINYLMRGFGVNLSVILETFLRAFDFENTTSGIIRSTQITSLIDGWKEAPLFGHGIGAYPVYIRNTNSPWSYEMVYHAFLYQVGIVGIISYGILIFSLLYKIYKQYKSNRKNSKISFSVWTAFICFLIAGASNPLVYYLWAWAFLFACSNVPLKEPNSGLIDI